MNQTDSSGPDSVLSYTDLAINCITLLVTAWTSYKLGHLNIKMNNVKCCGTECCDEFTIDISDSDEESISRAPTNPS